MLTMSGIDKRYGSVHANRKIDLSVDAGQIVGLLGENGSGKSTLMNVLFGMVRADAGTITFRGQPLAQHGPRQAVERGLGMIHQHFKLVESMTVLENILIGQPTGWLLDPRQARQRIAQTAQTYGLAIDPDSRVENLSFGERQCVEITRAIIQGAELLILDEPTSNLSPPEVEELLAFMRLFRDAGHSLIFITHKLDEVLAVCDEVVILRDGQVAGRTATQGTTRQELARLMVGRDVTAPVERIAMTPGRILLETVGLTCRFAAGCDLKGINLRVRSGEVLGIAGIDGNGQSELGDVLAGLKSVESGTIRLAEKDISDLSVQERIRLGLAYIPVDRTATSLVSSMSVADNLVLREFERAPYSHRGWLRKSVMAEDAREKISRFNIRADSPQVPARTLSGGNQQKIVLARELGRDPMVLVAHQPTWGLDPGATRFIMDQIMAMRARGGAVIYLASSLDEILLVSDRIAVLHQGHLSAAIDRKDVDLTEIGLLMAGSAAARQAGNRVA